MAEILSVVASGIAVSQAAQTVGMVIISLSRLWGEVNDVPETIQNIMNELELHGKLASAIETELGLSDPNFSSPESTPLTSIQCLTIQRCR